MITTVAGIGSCPSPPGVPLNYCGDGGPATSAGLCGPQSLAVDSAGNIYIADVNNWRVRKIDAATQTITTVAGTGTAVDSANPNGDGGPATRSPSE